MNLYLVPASQENVERTILRSVEMSVAERFLLPDDVSKLKNLLPGVRGLYCWAMTESSRYLFQQMSPGDTVLLTVKDTGEFRFRGTVVYTAESKTMGNFLWSYTPRKPWSLIYFLKNVTEINSNRGRCSKLSILKGDVREILKFLSGLNKGNRVGIAFYHYHKMNQLQWTIQLLSKLTNPQPKTIDL